MGTVYFEGAFLSETDAHLPLSDRGFQFGDGAFATIQVREGCPLFLQEHLEQLKKQCDSFHVTMPNVDRSIVGELIERNSAHRGIWRLKIFITGGDGAEGRLPQRVGREILLIKPFTPFPFKKLEMGLFSYPYSLCHASFKSLAHLNRFYVMEEAHQRHLDDCVTITEGGYLLEAAFGNLFWIHEKVLMTPEPSLPIYFGVTIRNALKIAEKLDLEVNYVKMKVDELPQRACAFRTNTMQGIRPIACIGNHQFVHHETFQSLFINGYEQMIEEERRKWAEKCVLA